MLRRFFERFQQCVESSLSQHVDFVDDVDFESTSTRSHADVGAKRANFVDTAIASSVDLNHINVFAGIDGLGDIGGVIGSHRRTVGIIERLGKNPRRARLADSACAGE